MPGLVVVTQPGAPVVLHKTDPDVEVHRDCVYVPASFGNFWENKLWGIYALDGRIIDAAAFRSLPGMQLTGQNETCLADIIDVPYAPCDRYFYVGNIINHYGHFICSSMARLWALPKHGSSSIPLVGHAAGGPKDWFSWPFVPTLFGSAGVVKEDFAQFDKPVRFRELVVAQPSFVEQNHSHTAHARSANGWGDRLIKTQNLSEKLDIIYLSRTRLGVQREGVSNEAGLVAALERSGVLILYPEQLSIPEQIGVFSRSKTIMGQAGSAFHTSFFSKPQPNQHYINIVDNPYKYSTNHALMDLANGNRTSYVYLEGHWYERLQGGRGFEIAEPDAAAQELLDLARSL